MKRSIYLIAAFACYALTLAPVWAQEPASEDDTESVEEYEGENASNPLAKVKNTDIRAQYFDIPDGSYRWANTHRIF